MEKHENREIIFLIRWYLLTAAGLGSELQVVPDNGAGSTTFQEMKFFSFL